VVAVGEELDGHDGSALMHWERLLDLDRDLAETLGEVVAARARDRIGVATVRLEPGEWRPEALRPQVKRAFALMICDGLVVRELDLAGTRTADLLGPGDLVSLGQHGDVLLATGESWHVSSPATVAVLDDRVLPALHAWPVLSARLIARVSRQAARAAEQRAISQLPRVELRIRALMWHLAERWGRMGPTGVVVPIELTHGALGRLVGARRPTVTLALGELARDGAMVRRNDGSWVLRVDSNPSSPPELSHARSGIAAVTLIGAGNGTAIVVTRPDGAILAERSERARAASEQQRERSQLVLERCRATRARATRIRTERGGRAA
jgi:CRP-like cAMP-binding protein